MKWIPIKTSVLRPPRQNLYPILDGFLPKLQNRDILIVASKVAAIHQGRCVHKKEVKAKQNLILKEADSWIDSQVENKEPFLLTIKEHTLIPSAGIDESNAGDYYVLWPKEVNRFAKELAKYLKKKNRIRNLGVLIVDSHTVPMRYGVLGICIGFWGMKPIADHAGKEDLFGRKQEYSKTNVVDALAAFSGLLMGEGKEGVPLLIARDMPNIVFTEAVDYNQLWIPREKDLYEPLLRSFNSF